MDDDLIRRLYEALAPYIGVKRIDGAVDDVLAALSEHFNAPPTAAELAAAKQYKHDLLRKTGAHAYLGLFTAPPTP